ncbi:hypothetical protein NLI96_g4035 [Meripilus lineatus]|uniref:Uncharacterized protein n=1 Tax=Meripilus lineatus TaxID=2056292 RepID=A0AAD5YIE8_9APHY|nr:hypothetical protein NLI96_g4035 [Physisporinus lineatus]
MLGVGSNLSLRLRSQSTLTLGLNETNNSSSIFTISTQTTLHPENTTNGETRGLFLTSTSTLHLPPKSIRHKVSAPDLRGPHQLAPYIDDSCPPTKSRDSPWHGIMGKAHIRYRLWRITTAVRAGGTSLHLTDYLDLLDFYLTAPLSSPVSDKAGSLLAELLHSGFASRLADAILTLPCLECESCLRSLGDSGVPGVCSLIFAIQGKRPSLLNRIFPLETFCKLITPKDRLQNLSTSAYFNRFFDTFFGTDGSSTYFPHPSHVLSWDIPEHGQSLTEFLLNDPKHESNLQIFADYLVSIVHPFSTQDPTLEGIGFLLEDSPRSRANHLPYPAFPMLFASHLAFRSKVAASILIDSSLLELLSRMWIFDFPDPYSRPAAELIPLRNDLRVVCMVLLLALSYHHPSTRDLIDHLLRTSFESCDDPRRSQNISRRRLDVQIPSLPAELWVKHPHFPSSITLSLAEICIANSVDISSWEEPMWGIIASILSRRDLTSIPVVTRDTAVRTLFARASTPKEDWKPIIRMLRKWPYERAHIAFTFIIQQYLGSVKYGLNLLSSVLLTDS